MAIPESQLEKWCNQGATVTSADAYNSIKTALLSQKSKVRERSPEIYLQGSYGNSTNIFADSDVDVVVQYNGAWYKDLAALPDYQKQAYDAAYSTSNYVWKQFYSDVLQTLTEYYGASAVKPGNKAIKVSTPNKRTADVIPAFQFKKYKFFQAREVESYVEGIHFENRAGRIIVNYPKVHMKNGEAKNAVLRTNRAYKQTIRMFKNARNAAIDKRLIGSDIAPSYFVECFLYNVPDTLFTADRQLTFRSILEYLWSKIPMDTAVCQNEQMLLFGSTPEQWDKVKAYWFVDGLGRLWTNW